MSGKDETPDDAPPASPASKPPRPTDQQRREAKLAEALRANLRRRKHHGVAED